VDGDRIQDEFLHLEPGLCVICYAAPVTRLGALLYENRQRADNGDADPDPGRDFHLFFTETVLRLNTVLVQ
jgi:hypothetical protein